MTKTKKPALRKMSGHPVPVDLEKLDRFASEADRPVETEAKKKRIVAYPWEENWVRSDVIKGMGVPLSEPHLLKLQYIARNTMYSQRGFCRQKLEEAIDREIEALIAEDKEG